MPKADRKTALRRRCAFGRAVRERREFAGLSLERLAEVAGVHRTYVGSVERGERNVSLDNIYAFADALNVPVRDLFAPTT